MGNCQGEPLSPEQKTDAKISKAIDALLKSEQKAAQRIKILLLGTGGSGKSTMFKQMKILHLNGFDDGEKKEYIPVVYENTVESMQALCQACLDFKVRFDRAETVSMIQDILDYNLIEASISHNRYSSAYWVELRSFRSIIQELWKDSSIKGVIALSNQFDLHDSAPYFLGNVDRMFREDYIPTYQDILRTRVPTSGIHSCEFELEKMVFEMVDVGGQRGERKKWIHCFDDVTAVMFICSLSEYDEVLQEDRRRNRMKEALSLFGGLTKMEFFRTIPMLLFLNKVDLFKQKISQVDLGQFFPKYKGGRNFEAAVEFIEEQYLSRNESEDARIYTHITNATDTTNIEFVWKAAKHIILEDHLKNAGIYLDG